MILHKVNCGIRRLVQGAFRGLFGVDAVRNAWDEGRETRNGEERWSSYLALDDSRCAKQRVASDRLCNRFVKLFETIVQQRRRRRRTTTRKGLDARTKFNFQPPDHFQNTRPQPNTFTSVTCCSKMSSSGDDLDVPEQVSLSTSKRQVIGRKKDVAKELAQAKSKQKEHNRERDRQLKQQTPKQNTDLIPDDIDEDGEPKDPRLLPDHLFAAAFNRPSTPPTSGPSVSTGAPLKTRHKERKRSDLIPKDRVIGQAFPSPSEGIQLTLQIVPGPSERSPKHQVEWRPGVRCPPLPLPSFPHGR